ncbi:MAG: LysR family transcriptional regulator [Anaerotruncus sp.]|nr:LysR family transcriptional regulator [Anaerotruncus sp.]
MKLVQLQYFRAVCKYNNITKAATELHITQPSISNAIKDLEEEFGVSLFYRLSKGISLTDEGRIFLEKANEILDSADALCKLMRTLGNKEKGIKIGVPPMIGTILFPNMFRRFREQHPEVNLSIHEQGSVQIRDLVADGTLDAAIISSSGRESSNFERVNILDTEILFCVSKNHPFASLQAVTIDRIKNEPLVLLKEDSYQSTVLKNLYRKQNIAPNVILYSGQVHTIKELVANGVAATVFFRGIVSPNEGIAQVPFEEPVTARIELIWNRSKHLYSDVAKFVEFTKNYHPD